MKKSVRERFFVDTCIFFGALNPIVPEHNKARKLLEWAFRKGFLYTSTWILDEVISLALSKRSRLSKVQRRELALRLIECIEESGNIELLFISPEVISSAKACFRKYRLPISLTDWTSAVLMENQGISFILSFDLDFDNIRKIDKFSFITRLEMPV
jgi:predicted nucleic acid-binding protein